VNVLISQRVDILKQQGERRDCLDQAWGKTLCDLLGRSVVMLPVPNRPREVAAMVAACQPSLIVLSGGNDIGEAPERDACEELLLDSAKDNDLPVLAVCRGMQMVQHYLGGKLTAITEHVSCEHQVLGEPGLIPVTLTVNSYHNWGIKQAELAPNLRSLYVHTDGTVEAVGHKHLPWLGIMWHPERASVGKTTANAWVAQWLKTVI